MDNDPDTWRWIWLIAALAFGAGEIAIAGSFFLAPFAIGALVAAILAFAGVGLGLEWTAFVVVSAALLAAMRPLAKRLDAGGPTKGVGAHRQLGVRTRVIEAIEGEHGHGFVMLGAEKWRAESSDGTPIPVGSSVTVTEVRGTRAIVSLVEPSTEDLTAD